MNSAILKNGDPSSRVMVLSEKAKRKPLGRKSTRAKQPRKKRWPCQRVKTKKWEMLRGETPGLRIEQATRVKRKWRAERRRQRGQPQRAPDYGGRTTRCTSAATATAEPATAQSKTASSTTTDRGKSMPVDGPGVVEAPATATQSTTTSSSSLGTVCMLVGPALLRRPLPGAPLPRRPLPQRKCQRAQQD